MDDNEQRTNPSENIEEVQNSMDAKVEEQIEESPSHINSATIEQLKSEQNFMGGILGGFLGAIVGAILWAVVTAITKYQIGYMAIGVGFLTGFMVKKLGQGVDKRFGFIGAIWALIGCFVGNILATLIMISSEESIPFMELLPLLDFDIIISIIKDTFTTMDLLFYGIAVYEGYRFSFLTAGEINAKLISINNQTV